MKKSKHSKKYIDAHNLEVEEAVRLMLDYSEKTISEFTTQCKSEQPEHTDFGILSGKRALVSLQQELHFA